MKPLTWLEFLKCLGVSPHPGQEKWLTRKPTKFSVLVTGRRWGKTFALAQEALCRLLTEPGCKGGIVSVTIDQARLCFHALYLLAIQNLPSAVKRMVHSPFPTLELVNGSSVTARSAQYRGVYIRGHGFSWVMVDEADYIQPEVLWDVISLSLADIGGELIMATTPRRIGGPAHQLIESGDPQVYVQRGRTLDNPYIDSEFVESLKTHLSGSAWAREVEGVYTEDENAIFSWQAIQEAYSSWTPFEPELCYIGCDPAGYGEDWTVITLLAVDPRDPEAPMTVLEIRRWQRGEFERLFSEMEDLVSKYPVGKILIDETGLGAPLLEMLRERVPVQVEGYTFTKRSKTDLLHLLRRHLEERKLRFPFRKELVEELEGYTYDDKGLRTDCVMSLALAVKSASGRRPFSEPRIVTRAKRRFL